MSIAVSLLQPENEYTILKKSVEKLITDKKSLLFKDFYAKRPGHYPFSFVIFNPLL